MNDIKYFDNGFRLKLVANHPSSDVKNWLFCPGGPGLGSESFGSLCEALALPGKTWVMDYPNDGSNLTESPVAFDAWQEGLVEVIQAFSNVIIVAHSFGGMLVLSEPKVEQHLMGLVLLNTAPNNQWIIEIANQAEQHDLPDILDFQALYQEKPSNDLFKELTIHCAPYFFLEDELEVGIQLLESLPYSHLSYDWAAKHFHPNYEAQWIPSKIPSLIIGGDLDHVTSFKLFKDSPSWQRDNVEFVCLELSGHFPWIRGAQDLKVQLDRYIEKL